MYRYRKFLKSKDLSVHSSEDLDCVLGRKRRKTSNPVENEKEVHVFIIRIFLGLGVGGDIIMYRACWGVGEDIHWFSLMSGLPAGM